MLRRKTRFWVGFAVCLAGILLSVSAAGHAGQHLAGGMLLLAGVLTAARHARN